MDLFGLPPAELPLPMSADLLLAKLLAMASDLPPTGLVAALLEPCDKLVPREAPDNCTLFSSTAELRLDGIMGAVKLQLGARPVPEPPLLIERVGLRGLPFIFY